MNKGRYGRVSAYTNPFTTAALNAAVAALVVRKKKGLTGYKKKKVTAVATRTRKRYAGSRTQTVTRRKRKVFQNNAIEHRAISLNVRARNPSAMKLAQLAFEPQWFRVQGMTQFDTSSGFYALASRYNTTTLIRYLPAHIWDLTCAINSNGASLVTPNVGYQLWQNTSGSCGIEVLGSQNAVGGTTTTSPLLVENVSNNGLTVAPFRKALHNWSHIKLNLYGVRNRATRWVVQLIMLKDWSSDFISAADSNLEKQKVYDYLTRPFMFNNLNSGDPQTKNDIKILRTYEVIIDPITADEITQVPKIQTLNWFIQHNRIRRYDWKRDAPPAAIPGAVFDQELDAGDDTRVDPKHRVYLILRALSPSRRDDANITSQTAADAATEPSYDMVLRQKFSIPL